MSWRNYKFYFDEVEARTKVALLRGVAGTDSAARVVKLPDGGYMAQLEQMLLPEAAHLFYATDEEALSESEGKE